MRVVSFFRLRGMVRDGDARSLIFDLDIVIQAWWSGLGEMTLKRSN